MPITKITLPDSVADLLANVLYDFLTRINRDDDYLYTQEVMDVIRALQHDRHIVIGVKDR